MNNRKCHSCWKRIGPNSDVCQRCGCHRSGKCAGVRQKCMCAYTYRECVKCGGHRYLDGHGDPAFPKKCRRCVFARPGRKKLRDSAASGKGQ